MDRNKHARADLQRALMLLEDASPRLATAIHRFAEDYAHSRDQQLQAIAMRVKQLAASRIAAFPRAA